MLQTERIGHFEESIWINKIKDRYNILTLLLHFPVDCCGKLRDSAEVCRGKANFITTISYIRLLVHNTQILTLNLYSLCLNFSHVLVFSMLRLNVFLTSRVQTNPACRYIVEVILSIKTPMKNNSKWFWCLHCWLWTYVMLCATCYHW